METVHAINNIVGKYKQGDLVLITGKAASGKTSYMIFDSINAALNGNKVLFCSVGITTAKITRLMKLSLSRVCKKSQKCPIDISIRQFDKNINFLSRLRSFLNSLKQRGDNYDIVYVETDQIPFLFSSKASQSHMLSSKQNLTELKKIAKDMGIVICISMNASCDNNMTLNFIQNDYEISEYVDFIFCLENNSPGGGAIKCCGNNSEKSTGCKTTNFKFNIMQVRERATSVSLDGFFDFKNCFLKFIYEQPQLNSKTSAFLNSFDGISMFFCETSGLEGRFVDVILNSFLQQYKNVLHIRQAENYDIVYESNRGKIHVVGGYNNQNLTIDVINSILDKLKFVDYVIIDDINSAVDEDLLKNGVFFDGILNIFHSKKIKFVIGAQMPVQPLEINTLSVALKQHKVVKCNFCIGVKEYKGNIFQKIINFLTRRKPLFSVNVIKNRYGENYKTTLFLNKKTQSLKIV